MKPNDVEKLLSHFGPAVPDAEREEEAFRRAQMAMAVPAVKTSPSFGRIVARIAAGFFVLLALWIVAARTREEAREQRDVASPQDAAKPKPVGTTVKIGSHEVEIRSTALQGQVRVSVSSVGALEFALPERAGRITEIAGSKWQTGLAMAIEAESADGSRRSYYWATMNGTHPLEKGLQVPAVDAFLTNVQDDLEITSIENLGRGDRIRILLLNREGLVKEGRVGHLYVNDCPVDPKFRAHTLYELRAVVIESPK